MKKRFPISITLTLALSLLTFTPISNAASTNAQDIVDNYVFNSELGFSLIFPPGWENMISSGRTLDWETNETSSSIDFGFPDEFEMFNISQHEIVQWNNIVTQETTPPILIDITETHAIGYTKSQSEHAKMADISWIIDNASINKTTLNDITGTQNETAIQYLLNNEVISGYLDGSFKPGKTINRAELMKILTEGTGTTPGEEYNNCFPDVTDQWFAKYVCYAKEQNWIQGYPDETFKPAKEINKAEAIKMIINSQSFNIPGAVNDPLFDDIDNSAWYAPFVKAAKDKGLLEITSGEYGISEQITREEVSENIYRALLISVTNSFIKDPKTTSKTTANSETTPATIDGYSIFLSEPFSFNIEYPDQWYYEGLNSADSNVTRLYNFGPGLIDDEPAIVRLELRTGVAPDGTVTEINKKTLITVTNADANESNVYYADENRLYRLISTPEYKDIILQMASTITPITATP